MQVNDVTDAVIGAAIAVHRELGPGLLESAYEACLAFELADRRLSIERQVSLPVRYRGQRIECGYRMDMVVEDCVILELKAVESLSALHEAQLLSYLRLSGKRVGLLLNFNVRIMKHGIRRLVLGHDDHAGHVERRE
ncbi:MAG: GxxExxY protein [Mariprofundaceae bacterium]